jgi:uncharacterized membrane protein
MADPFIIKFAQVIVNPAIKGAFLIALLVFLYGLMNYIRNADESAERTKGKNAIFWGVIGMSIMVAVAGIIRIAIGTINTLK